MKRREYLGVFLGRISPLHKGHQKIIDKMISDFGIENCMILIGSSNTCNERTPYTFSERKNMVKILYPDIYVSPFPDVNPNKDIFEVDSLKLWLLNLKKMEEKMKKEFVFYGGSEKDVYYLKDDFKIKIAADRNRRKDKISATKIRELIKSGDQVFLEKYLDRRVIPLAISGLRLFRNSK